MSKSEFGMLCVLGVLLVGSGRLVAADVTPPETPAPATQSVTPTTSPEPEVWSDPEPGQSREESLGTNPTPETPSYPRENKPPSASQSSPEIWSTPEPGRGREYSLPTPPQDYSLPPERHSRRRNRTWEPDQGTELKELGVTLGTPSILNLNIGYWGAKSFPCVVRLSGMYYGVNRGVQLDLGYAFSRENYFRQYLALSFVTMQTSLDYFSFHSSGSTNFYQDVFTGVGPSYGLNWYGLAFQLSLPFGQDINTQSYWYSAGQTTLNQFIPEILFQIGYTFLW